ncbi:MAG TPA: glycosyltransferase, partial [Dehalococcoidia bacterium]
YNMASYLTAAIDSALAQDHDDVDILVVDDGSTDDTRQVVSRYGRKVRYHHQENAGVANAYNRMLELAKGEYVHFLDADDVLTPSTVGRLAGLLDESPSAGMAYGDALVVDAAGKVYGTRVAPAAFAGRRLIPSAEAFRELLRGCHITTSAAMIRKSVRDRVTPFRQKAVPGEDWDMWLRVAAAYDVVHLPISACYYRVHDDSITSAYTVERVVRSHLYTLDTIFGNPTFRYAYLRSYAYACLDRTIARVAARARERKLFFGELRNALVRQPSIALEGATMATVVEGLKAMVPAPVIRAGKRLRGGMATRMLSL